MSLLAADSVICHFTLGGFHCVRLIAGEFNEDNMCVDSDASLSDLLPNS